MTQKLIALLAIVAAAFSAGGHAAVGAESAYAFGGYRAMAGETQEVMAEFIVPTFDCGEGSVTVGLVDYSPPLFASAGVAFGCPPGQPTFVALSVVAGEDGHLYVDAARPGDRVRVRFRQSARRLTAVAENLDLGIRIEASAEPELSIHFIFGAFVGKKVSLFPTEFEGVQFLKASIDGEPISPENTERYNLVRAGQTLIRTGKSSEVGGFKLRVMPQ